MFNVSIDISEVDSLEDLKILIARFCNELLHRNPKKLTQIIYRIDLKEHLVSQALNNLNQTEIPTDLANLMIHRTQTKVALKKVLNFQLEKNKKLPRY